MKGAHKILDKIGQVYLHKVFYLSRLDVSDDVTHEIQVRWEAIMTVSL